MQVGGIWQNGQLNQVSLVVGGLGGSDGNLFGAEQRGDRNSIDGTINGAGGNEAVVKQHGNNNIASFVQNGGGNIVAISQ